MKVLSLLLTVAIAICLIPQARAELITVTEAGGAGAKNPVTACANQLAVNAFCNEAWISPALDAGGNFTATGNWGGADLFGLYGTQTLTATVTDVNGGAGLVTITVLEDYTTGFAPGTPLRGFGVLSGNCTAVGGGGLPAGSSITGQIFLNTIGSNVTGGNCPAGVNGAVPLVPAFTFAAAQAGVTFFDGAATFTFAAGTPAGATLSIPLTEGDAPEPSTLFLMAGASVLLFAANRHQRARNNRRG